MNRRALILDELGLSPVWVRKEILAELQAKPVEPAHVAVASNSPAPRPQGFSPVAVAAHQALAPLVSPAKFTPPPAQTLPANDPIEDERSLRIARMNWQELNAAVSTCTACPLCEARQKTGGQTVFGSGPMQANIMVIGEAPDADEETQQTPFLGDAGKLLNNMLATIGEDEQVYKTNILKCRPPNKRNPQAAEVLQCAPFLKRQIELIQPKTLLLTGRFAMKTLLESDEPVSVLREKLQQYKQIPLVVSYNPSYLLRNLPDKSRAWHDILRLKAALKNSRH